MSAEEKTPRSEKRLAQAIAMFKRLKFPILTKQIFSKGQHVWIFPKTEHQFDQAVILAPDEYWVLVFYDGYRKRLWPITPEWIDDEQAEAWLAGWNAENQALQKDEENDIGYLQREINRYEGFASQRTFTFQTKDGFKRVFTGEQDDLEYDKEWPSRDREIDVEIGFPEGMDEQNCGLAQKTHDLLKTAYETLTEEPWGASSQELTESQAKALVHAFRAGREAEKFGSYDNIAIAKDGAPFVFKKAPKGIRETWRRAAWEFMLPIIESGIKVTAQQVAQHLRQRSLADFYDEKWMNGDPKLEVWTDDEGGYLIPWKKRNFNEAVSTIRRRIREFLKK